MKKEKQSMFWDINKSLSYNCLFNFIVGNRGGGKTYGAKKYCIDKFLRYEEEFVYLRRYKEEIKNIKNFFDDIEGAYPDHKFKVRGRDILIDDCVAGHVVTLSTAKISKSVSYSNVSTIVFDEFILDKGYYHYLPDEVTYFLDLYETIARMRDNVKVFFLSNALTITNPYFLYFKIKIPYNKTISHKGDILIEMVQNKAYIDAKKNTRFGKMIQGTAYGNYAINNEFFRDDKTFVEKKTGDCKYYFGFKYMNTKYGVWLAIDEGKIYVSNDYEPKFPIMYALTKADHNANTLLIDSIKRTRPFNFFLKNFQMGNVYFESVNIKNVCYEVLRLSSNI